MLKIHWVNMMRLYVCECVRVYCILLRFLFMSQDVGVAGIFIVGFFSFCHFFLCHFSHLSFTIERVFSLPLPISHIVFLKGSSLVFFIIVHAMCKQSKFVCWCSFYWYILESIRLITWYRNANLKADNI